MSIKHGLSRYKNMTVKFTPPTPEKVRAVYPALAWVNGCFYTAKDRSVEVAVAVKRHRRYTQPVAA